MYYGKSSLSTIARAKSGGRDLLDPVKPGHASRTHLRRRRSIDRNEAVGERTVRGIANKYPLIRRICDESGFAKPRARHTSGLSSRDTMRKWVTRYIAERGQSRSDPTNVSLNRRVTITTIYNCCINGTHSLRYFFLLSLFRYTENWRKNISLARVTSYLKNWPREIRRGTSRRECHLMQISWGTDERFGNSEEAALPTNWIYPGE